jgi:NDP-sugar pyrophosphorylase family protein
VLAGGRGTRLAAVAPDRQKVSLEVAGRPMALRLAAWLAGAGVSKVVFAAGHLADDIRAMIEANPGAAPELALSVEHEPLGTAGAARRAAGLTRGDPVLVLNGDSFAEIDLERLYEFHRQAGAKASIALIREPEPGRYGLVITDPQGAVVTFQEKPDRAGGAGWINAGIYLFERAQLLAIERGPVSFEREVFPALIGRGLYARAFDARFIDIGTPQSLEAAETFFGATER